MKKTIKTSTAAEIFGVLNQAKYSKMDDKAKVKAWKITREIKAVATKFTEDSKDAAEKLKPSDKFDDQLTKAQEYERLKEKKEPTIDVMSTADYEAFIASFRDYNKLVGEAVKDFGEKEVDVEFEPLSEEEYGKLMASNDWTLASATLVGDFVCE